MKLLFLLIVVAGGSAEELKDCNTCIKFHDQCHNVTHVVDLPAKFRADVVIKKLEVLKTKRILFYSYEPELSDPEYYKTAYIDLNNHDINGVVGANTNVTYNLGTFAIDQRNGIVYLGGSLGLYQMTPLSYDVQLYTVQKDVTSVFFRDDVYYVISSEDKIIKFKNDQFLKHLDSEHFGKVKNFVVTKDATVFLTTTGLYVANVYNETARISKNAFFRGLSIDNNNSVYAWWVDGIYQVDISKKLKDCKLVKVANIPGIGALTFDDNNDMIFTSSRVVFRLLKMPANTTC